MFASRAATAYSALLSSETIPGKRSGLTRFEPFAKIRLPFSSTVIADEYGPLGKSLSSPKSPSFRTSRRVLKPILPLLSQSEVLAVHEYSAGSP